LADQRDERDIGTELSSGGESRPIRLPGPAEAGLLFSLMAFLQLYAGWLPFPDSLSDSDRLIATEVLFIGFPPLLAAFALRFSLKDTFRVRLPRLREVGVIALMAPFSTMAAYSAGILAIVLVRLVFGASRMSGDLGDVLTRGMPLAILTIGVVPAVCEEVLFRGFIQRGLEGLGPKKAVLLSGLLFGLFHFDFQRLAAQTLLGFVIAYVVYRSGSIFNGMLVHFLHNSGSVLLTGLAGGLGLTGSWGTILSFAGTAGGDVFENPAFLDYVRRTGMPLEKLIGMMGAGSALILFSALTVLGGLLFLFRHITRDRPRPKPSGRTSAVGFLMAVPGLLLILVVYAAIALELSGLPAGEFLMRMLGPG